MIADSKPKLTPRAVSRILVTDDDPIFAALAASSLRQAGFEIEIACDGAEAIDALELRTFAAALVDLSMPRVDGFKLIALVRATPRLRKLPIIVLSSLNDADAVADAYSLGADAYQSKPVNWALLPTLLSHVSLRRLQMIELEDAARAVLGGQSLARAG